MLLRHRQEVCTPLQAGVAVVPFQAFDMPAETGWFRMSVGAVGTNQLASALERIEAALQAL